MFSEREFCLLCLLGHLTFNKSQRFLVPGVRPIVNAIFIECQLFQHFLCCCAVCQQALQNGLTLTALKRRWTAKYVRIWVDLPRFIAQVEGKMVYARFFADFFTVI